LPSPCPRPGERLKAIYEHTDGFVIAREDLRIRGPGEFIGARQSGVPLLRYADLEADAPLVEVARELAESLLRDAPQVADVVVTRWFGGRASCSRLDPRWHHVALEIGRQIRPTCQSVFRTFRPVVGPYSGISSTNRKRGFPGQKTPQGVRK
jgi:hypothetical protein